MIQRRSRGTSTKWSPTRCRCSVRAGHIPILGEWLALPLAHLAGSKTLGDAAFQEVFHPVAVRLLSKCDAVLRVGGESVGADEMVRVGRELGLQIIHGLDELHT